MADKSMQMQEEKFNLFKKNAEATTATVQFVSRDPNLISKAILDQINSEKQILVSVLGLKLIDPFIQSIDPVYEPTDEEISKIPICVTDSICGLTETGSVLISSDLGYGSYFSMITKKHIVLLNASELYDRPRDVFNSKNIELTDSKSFSLITGPSATADMGSLVRGVHGPEKLHIIVIGEYEK